MRIRTAAATLTVLVVVIAAGGVLAWRHVSRQLALKLPAVHECAVSTGDDKWSLDADQMANAATVSAVGISRHVPERAIVIALATALQESKLHNLSAGDRDSVGLFQQRPSQGWGTPEQISDPRYAAKRFYAALVKVPGWQMMRVTDAAQQVQRSAYPEAYEKWSGKADLLSRALVGNASGAVSCTVAREPTQRGPAAADALAAGLRLDWGDSIKPVASPQPPGLALSVADERAGWRYAHWLVAHAEERGVKRVRFGDREWTAKGGTWGTVTADPTTDQVLAEVHSDG